ncbi:MAG TPA: DUF3857 domain-containing protein, partial [Puia sp.]|nr:DUF3857 domain-containing protein [Puia sp.]
MRTPISVILLSCLTLRGHAVPIIRTGAIPSWVTSTHPDRSRQPSTEDISNGYYYELQDQQTNLPLETEYFHTIRHLINRSGVQYGSEVSVTYSPQFQEVVFHRISVIRDGVTIDELCSAHVRIVEEEPDADVFQYSGKKMALFMLSDIREGDRIDVAYSVIGFNPVFHGKYGTLHYFTRSTAVCNYFRTIITSADRPL